jgi:pimeloyl-ACP methyl ester carboxylesterase
MLMPALARDFFVVAVDQRGIGLSGNPQDGYDTATLASDLAALMDALGHYRFAVYGTDVEMPIAYALAADHPGRLDRLVVSEAPLPGISPSPPLFLPPLLNERLWHLAFNQLPRVNEQLVTGREDIFFGAEFDASAGTNKLPRTPPRSVPSGSTCQTKRWPTFGSASPRCAGLPGSLSRIGRKACSWRRCRS